MATIALDGDPPIDIDLRRSARARRISLRLSGLDGRVTLTLPPRVPESEGLAFLRAKEGWLRDHLARQAAPVAVGLGAMLPLEGVPHEVVAGTGRSVRVAEGALQVPGAAAQAPARLLGFLKTRARERLALSSDLYAARLGRRYSRITLRDTRSRWGSCTSDGALMFSWRLILAPPGVLEYVAAHEVAHLAEMNHGRRFWEAVTRIHGEWRVPRDWLRKEGAGLHRYRFGD